jgi:hypothetical protein
MALAVELGATLLIDETDGRATAAAAQVPFIGVLGILGPKQKAKVFSARCVHFLIAFAGNWAFELRSGSTGSFKRRSASFDSFMENVVGRNLLIFS